MSVQAHARGIFSAAFSPDGRLLATGGRDEVVVWSMPEFRRLYSFKAHNLPTLSVMFSRNGKSLMTAGGETLMKDDGTIKIWSVPYWVLPANARSRS